MYQRFFKRPLDIIGSSLVLIITSPILVVAIVALALQNRWKIFFIQKRPGMHQQPFYIVKLRTMNDVRDASGNLLPDNARITKVGRWIRKLSLDELPQLWNVIKGDMSLIGPRPLLFKYVPLYSKDQNRRHDLRPGITGWAQVNGRNSISWSKKFELDTFYVDNLSFFLDLRIFWLTILKIIKREGINQSEKRPMEPFTGTN
jgi:lipopolysaccharide/colanic/teichoic acid biosynthesis glycosyltransferase